MGDGPDDRQHPARSRRSIRAKGHDYTDPGAYFVTICVHGRVPLLGTIEEGAVRLSAAGEMVLTTWRGLRAHIPYATTDAFVVMPNHVHGVVWLGPTEYAVECDPHTGLVAEPDRTCATGQGEAVALGDVVGRWKSFTARVYGDAVRTSGWPPFEGRLWQRDYFERIIRNERELAAIREYIMANPAMWGEDQDNPDAPRSVTEAPWR